MKSFRLKPGTRVGNYRIIRPIGRGFEGEVYCVREIPTGAKRAIKIYPEDHPDTIRDLVFRARLLERLACTGATVRYYHLGREFLDGRFLPVLYQVLELVEGAQLPIYLRRITGTKRRRTARALALILAITSHIGRVHRLGIALGDFDTGENILVRNRSGQPVFCDALFGANGRPNQDYGNDLRELREVCLLILYRTRTTELKRLVLPLINRYLRLRPRRDLVSQLAGELEKRFAVLTRMSARSRATSAR